MNQESRYFQFIESRKNRVLPQDIITEKHHILPKSLGGSNDFDNLIALTPQEHYIAHKLLYEENPCRENACAWHFMSTRNSVRITEEEYQKIREILYHNMSGENNPRYGKKHTDETKRKISVSLIGEKNPNWGRCGEKNPMYGVIRPEEWCIEQSIRMSGENNPNYGKCDEKNPMYGHTSYRCLETGVIIKASFELQEFTNNSNAQIGRIRQCALGKAKTAYGYHWEVVE